jgi:hypothetical protein
VDAPVRTALERKRKKERKKEHGRSSLTKNWSVVGFLEKLREKREREFESIVYYILIYNQAFFL